MLPLQLIPHYAFGLSSDPRVLKVCGHDIL